MQVNLGMVQGTMNQSSEAASSGIGGWLDAMSYMAGLSGGSWGTGSFMANGGMLPSDLVTNVWNLASNLVYPSDDKTSFYYDLVSEVDAKESTGFQTQVTDFWALALGNHLLPSQYHLDNSPNYTFSQLSDTVPAFANASLPFPIIIAAEREPGTTLIAENATYFELTPLEFGSWSWGNTTRTTGAFTPIEYLGSSLNNGQPNGTTCWKGFDQLSFVMGTSSTLFNDIITTLDSANASGVIIDAISSIVSALGDTDNDVALYPNSFANYEPSTNPVSDLQYITLVDGGETNQNVPLEPLLVSQRSVDAVLAFDASADTGLNWPNGSSLWTTWQRAAVHSTDGNFTLRMPQVPSTAGFINGGWNQRPTFFGCNDTDTPVVVYVPSYPWSYYANTTTLTLEYDNSTAAAMVLDGMRSMTLNGSVEEWPRCLACAMTDRAFAYTAQNRSEVCQGCFDRWCWDGTDNTTEPDSYEPVLGSVPPALVKMGVANATATNSDSGGGSSSSSAASGGAPAVIVPALWPAVWALLGVSVGMCGLLMS